MKDSEINMECRIHSAGWRVGQAGLVKNIQVKRQSGRLSLQFFIKRKLCKCASIMSDSTEGALNE